MAAQVIPFDFETHEVRTLLIDDQPWFVAADVAAALNYRMASDMTRNLDDDEKGTQIVRTPQGKGRHNLPTLGGEQTLSVINESGLYSAILRSRKAEAKRFKKWVTAEVLPAIRKHGRYEDRNDQMGSLMMDAVGVSELTAIKGVIKDKAKQVVKDKRRSFMQAMHQRLHTRFNVPRTELIPHKDFAEACNFIAAYAIDGEYLPKQDGIQLEPKPNARYLVSFNHKGEQRIDDLPSDACVMTHQEMMKAMTTPGELPVSTDEMFEFTMAALANLKVRSWSQAQRLKHATSK